MSVLHQVGCYFFRSMKKLTFSIMWAMTCEKVPYGLSRCHTKRSMDRLSRRNTAHVHDVTVYIIWFSPTVWWCWCDFMHHDVIGHVT